MIAWRELLWAAGVLCLVVLVSTGPALFGDKALGPDRLLDWDPLYRTTAAPELPPSSDLTVIVQDLPKELAFARGLRERRLDAWNPLAGCGMPLWADHVGPFFPLKIPFYLAPSRVGYTLFLAARLVLAALGAFVLARRRGLSSRGALVAGATFGCCGALIGHAGFGSASPVFLIPWLLLGSEELGRGPTPRRIGAAGLVIGLAASGGHPTLVYFALLTFGTSALAQGARSWRKPRHAGAVLLGSAAALTIGVLLAAPSLVPFVELLLSGSSYKQRLAGVLMRQWQLNESREMAAITLFAPGLIPLLHPRIALVLSYGAAIGTLGLVFGAVGAWKRGLDASLIAIGLLGLGLTIEPWPLAWLGRVPGISFVLPTYAWVLFGLVATQAAGRGVDVLLYEEPRQVARVLVVAMVLLAVLGGGLLMLVRDVPPKPFATILAETLGTSGGWVGLVWPILLAAAILIAGTALRALGSPRAAFWVVTAGMVAELVVCLRPVLLEDRSHALGGPPSPAVRFLQAALEDGESRFQALPLFVGTPMTPMLFGLADVRMASPLPVRRYAEYLEAISAHAGGISIYDIPKARSALLDLAAVRYVVWARPGQAETPAGRVRMIPAEPPPENDPELPVVFADEHVVIHENRRVLPRTRIVRRTVALADESAAVAWARSLGATAKTAAELDWVERVALEPAADGTPPPILNGEVTSRDGVRVVPSDNPDRLALDVDLVAPGVVVVADTMFPGWSAVLDGRPAAIHPANLLFRAVAVPAGRHRLEFHYRPTSLWLGFASAALASITIVTLWFLGGAMATSWTLRSSGRDGPRRFVSGT